MSTDRFTLIPDDATERAYNSSIIALRAGKIDEALKFINEARTIEPQNPQVGWQRAVTLLLAGRWADGWAEAEWRIANEPQDFEPLPGEYWAGQDLDGKTLVIHTEGGIGDIIFFARYLPWASTKGGPVIFLCPDSMGELFNHQENIETCWPAMGGSRNYDYWCYIGSLPHFHGTRPDHVPPPLPHYRATVQARKLPLLQTDRKKKIGYCWKGSMKHRHDDTRSTTLDAFAPLLEMQGYQAYSFQVGTAAQELRDSRWSEWIIDLEPQLTDWLQTAKLLVQMNVVVTVDTAIAHLAASLGIETHMVQSVEPDWRWKPEATTSVWYPTMRIYPQKHRHEWGSVIAAVLKNLRETRSGPSILVSGTHN